MRSNRPVLFLCLALGPPALVTLAAIPAAHAVPPAWATLGASSQRQAHSLGIGPDDPLPAPAPWPYLTAQAVATSPALDADGLAYFASQKDVHVVEPRGTGHVIYSAKAPIHSSPTLFRSEPRDGLPPIEALYFGSEDGTVTSIDLTGALRWTMSMNRLPIRSSPAVTQIGRDVYVAVADQSTLYVYREPAVGVPVLAWFTSVLADPAAMTSPAISPNGTRVFFATADGNLRCNELTSGAPRGVFTAGAVGRLTTPLVTDAGAVVFGAEDGHVYQTDGDCHLLATRVPGGPIRVPAARVDGGFVVNADGTLFQLDASLNPTWSVPLPAFTARAAPISDGFGRVYLAGEDATVHGVALPAGTVPGGLWWSTSLPFTVSSQLGTPAMALDGSIYVPGFEGWLHVLRDTPAFRIAYQRPGNGSFDIAYLNEIYGTPRSRTVYETPGSDDFQPSFDYGAERLALSRAIPSTPLDVMLGGRGVPLVDVTAPWPGLSFTFSSLESEPAFSAIDPGTGASRLPDKGRYVGYSFDTGSGSEIRFTDLVGLARGLRSAYTLFDWAMLLQGVPTGVASQLTRPGKTQSQLALSPDGLKLAFHECPVGQTSGCVVEVLWRETTYPMKWRLEALGSTGGVEGGSQLEASSPAFSPDGNFLAVHSGNGLLIWPVGSNKFVVPIGIPALPNETLDNPSWSPDGTEIVASSNRTLKLFRSTRSLVVFSGNRFQTRSSTGAGSGNDDHPFYHYRRMPAPIGGRLTPDRAFTGDLIGVRGRGFDLIDPLANYVWFTDVLGTGRVHAQVFRGEVDPFTGEGILWVMIPVQAGNGPVTVQTVYGTTQVPGFLVQPRPVSLRQTRSAPGLRIRVEGTGFELAPTADANTTVDFTAQAGGWVSGKVLGGTQTADGQELIVEIQTGVAKQGPVRAWARTEQEGDTCCTFERLDPTLVVARTSGIAANAAEGCSGAGVVVTGTDFPLDVPFGQGVGTVSLAIAGVDLDAGMPKATLSPSATAPDTAEFSITRTIPSLPAGTGGSLTATGTSDATPVVVAMGMFRVPLANIPIVFIPGTSGNTLNAAAPMTGPPMLTPDVHNFPQNSGDPLLPTSNDHGCNQVMAAAAGIVCPLVGTFPYFPPGFFAGEEVWPGKLVQWVLDPFNAVSGNMGAHYLDIAAFTAAGTQAFPMVPGSVLMDYAGSDIYGHLINKLSSDLMRPIGSGANGIFPFAYDFRDSFPVQAAALSTFVDGILASTGASSVVLVTQSLGGMVARAYYLSPAAAGKVDQVISLSGGFAGAPLTAKILAVGDDWGHSYGLPGYTVGVAPWEVEVLAQNWPTAYFQLPNAATVTSTAMDPWFFDHGTQQTHGSYTVTIDRRYIRDNRPVPPGQTPVVATTASHLAWLAAKHNGTIAGMVIAFAGTIPTPMGDFRMGTGSVMHHRIFSRGNWTVTAVQLDPTGQGWTKKSVIYGDGDETVPYHGMLGLTDSADDRLYIAQATSGGPDLRHLPLSQNNRTITLIEGLINGTVCTQAQANALDSLWESQTTAQEYYFETPGSGGAEYVQLPSD